MTINTQEAEKMAVKVSQASAESICDSCGKSKAKLRFKFIVAGLVTHDFELCTKCIKSFIKNVKTKGLE